MILISQAVAEPDATLPEIVLLTDRITLAKRLWRGSTEDGTEFGFDLSTPLRHGDTFHQTASARYMVFQEPEPVIEINLDLPPSAAAGIGWAIGNLHLELSSEATRLLAVDTPAIRQLLERLRVPFRATTAIFRPGRFARGQPSPHELGPSHQH